MYREKIRDLFQLLFNNTTTGEKIFINEQKTKIKKERVIIYDGETGLPLITAVEEFEIWK